MKKTVGAVGAAALSLGLLGSPAFADSEKNWDQEKVDQVAINRCANAGIGDGGETIDDDGECRKSDGIEREAADRDIDPGNSGAHNANNDG